MVLYTRCYFSFRLDMHICAIQQKASWPHLVFLALCEEEPLAFTVGITPLPRVALLFWSLTFETPPSPRKNKDPGGVNEA